MSKKTKPPRRAYEEFFDRLNPEMWKCIEQDVLSRLHALQEVSKNLNKASASTQDLYELKRVIVGLLALLGEFTSNIKQAGDYIILDLPKRSSVWTDVANN